MELSPSLVTLGLAALAGVAWLIRLESKANTAIRDHDGLSKDFYAHAADDHKHFNLAAFAEFEKRIEGEIRAVRDSVGDVKADVKEVKEYCEDIDGKIDRLKQ